MAAMNFSHGGNIYAVPVKQKGAISDFSANINPLGLPRKVRKAISGNLSRILHYPEPEGKGIKKKIASYWGIAEDNILLGNGSTDLIYLIVSTLIPKTALIPVPTFSEYERAVKSADSKIRFLKLEEKNNFRLNSSGLIMADIFFLCHPNNPTGNIIFEDYKNTERLADKLVVVDEAFMDFLPNQPDYTLIPKAVKTRKIAVLRTFTKFFALPGLRMGYLIAHKDLVGKLRQKQPPWTVNSLAQLAAEIILGDKEYSKKTHTVIKRERRFLEVALAKIKGIKLFPSETNFILIRIQKPRASSQSLRRALIKEGILIRDCANFRNLGDKYIRVAVRSHSENMRLVTAFKKVI